MFHFNFTIFNLISVLICCVSVLYVFQIGTLKKTKTIENTYFTYYLGVLTLIVFLYFLIDLKLENITLKFVVILFIVLLSLLISPLLWLYVRGINYF